MIFPVVVALVIGIIGIGVFYYFKNNASEKNNENEAEKESDVDKQTENNKHDKKTDKKNNTVKQNKVNMTTTKNKFTNAINQKEHPLYWKEIGGHVTPSCCVCFSPKNNLIASASQDGMIRGLPLSDVGVVGAHDIFTNVGGTPTALSFTQNGRRIVVAIKGTLKFYSFIISETERKIEFAKNLETGMKFISSIQLMDVEQWMVVVVCGRDESDAPCIRAFDRQGTRIANFVQIKRKGRVDKNRIPLPKKAMAVASPDDR